MSLLQPNLNAPGLCQFSDRLYEVINIHGVDYRTKMSYVNVVASSSFAKRGSAAPEASPAHPAQPTEILPSLLRFGRTVISTS
jgi:hypothetical protein